MTIEQLLSLQRAEPFQPYKLHLADGRNIEIRHPEFVARSPAGRTIVVYRPDETFEAIDLLLVVSLETVNGRENSGR